jgi:hypothetical protein
VLDLAYSIGDGCEADACICLQLREPELLVDHERIAKPLPSALLRAARQRDVAQARGGQRRDLARARLTRRAVDRSTDRANCSRVLARNVEVRPHRPRPGDEKRDRLVLDKRGRIRRMRLRRQLERTDGVLVLRSEAERRAARREHVESGSGGEQLGDCRSCGQDVLEVVRHEQGLAVVEGLAERIEERLPAGLGHSEGTGNRSDHQLGLSQRSEVDEMRTIRVFAGQFLRDGESDARLPGAADSGERQQANLGQPQKTCDGAEFEPAADERRRRRRQTDALQSRRRCRRIEIRVLAEDPRLELP